MSVGDPGIPREQPGSQRGGEPRGQRGKRRQRVVISSLTGKPIPWPDAEGAELPVPRPDAREAHMLRDVPPHWGRAH